MDHRYLTLQDDDDSLIAQNLPTPSYDEPIDPKEPRYRLGSLIIFFIDSICLAASIFWMARTIVMTQNLLMSIPISVLNLIVTVVLGNGLFGWSFRGKSLYFYMHAFEIAPAVLHFIALFILVFGFCEIEEDMREMFPNSDATLIMASLISFNLGAVVYHGLAAIVISKYRTLRRRRDWSF